MAEDFAILGNESPVTVRKFHLGHGYPRPLVLNGAASEFVPKVRRGDNHISAV